MHLTYTTASGESVTLRPRAPFFLGKADGLATIRQSVNTFGAPEQDGAFWYSKSVDGLCREIGAAYLHLFHLQ